MKASNRLMTERTPIGREAALRGKGFTVTKDKTAGATTRGLFVLLLMLFGASSGFALVVNTLFDPGSESRAAGLAPALALQGNSDGVSGHVIAHPFSNLLIAPPANDNFVNAQAITGASGNVSGTSSAATKETGEPNHAGYNGGASVWYRWQAPTTGPVTFDTFGSSFDTLLAVYTGTGVSGLTYLTASEDSSGFLQSSVTFTAQAGVVYQVAVDGFGGVQGSIVLTWNQSLPTPTPTPTPPVALTPGVAQTGSIPAPTAGTGLLGETQYTIDVPAGVSKLDIDLVGNQGVDVDLHVRFGQRVALENGELAADYKAQSPHEAETVVVASSSSPPLRPGTYFIAVENFGPGLSTFSVTASFASNSVNGKIAFVREISANNSAIFSMNSDGTNPTRLTNNPHRDEAPAWSPDGSKIAFHIFDDVVEDEIYVINADGSNQTRLTNNSTDDNRPAWSPDGTRIVFDREASNSQELYLMNADGSNQIAFTNNSVFDGAAVWSPDGNRLAYERTGTSNSIDVYARPFGGFTKNLTKNAATDEHPTWSPDGNRIAFASDRDGNLEIYVMNSDGSGQTRLTNSSASETEPAWSPDGAKIAFASNRDGNFEIYVMDANGANQTRVTFNATADQSPAWQPLATPTVQFSASTASATETANATTTVNLVVTRSGDTTASATVNYASSDGTASERSDYLAALGTLHFAAGETSKTITVFIVDDALGEGAETFSLTLSNPAGVGLGALPTITITITSDEIVNGQNPVKDASFNTDFFVRQHYIDFFNREADASGLAFWKNQIDECTTQACSDIRKINVSAAFFLSIEFQQTGYLVYKANQASFNSGEFLRLRDFLPDTQEIGRGVVIGQPGADAQLEANKQAFFLNFVQRTGFLVPTAYPTTMTAAEFVDKLNANTFDPLNTGSGGALSPSQRDALVIQLSPNPASPTLRAQVLRSVAENSLFNTRQSNKAFVLMQYFGYLRRNPNDPPEIGLDFAGYNFWLSKLNQFNGNFVNAEMVKAFIVSGEYQGRFGP